MPTVTTATATVAYDDIGSGNAGNPLILLQATLHDRSDFDEIAAELAKGRRVIAIDWPGHGDSPLPIDGRAPGSAVFADVLEEFVDELDLTGVVLIGNSVGGHAACRLAVTRPDRVAGIVTVQGSGFTPTNALIRWYCRFLGRPETVRRFFPALIKAYMRPRSPHDTTIVDRASERATSQHGAQTAAAMWRSFAEPDNDLRPYADQIRVPVLVTWGMKDVAIPTIWAKKAHRAIFGSQFVPFATGHIPFSSDPAGFLKVVEPFLAALAATQPGTTATKN